MDLEEEVVFCPPVPLATKPIKPNIIEREPLRFSIDVDELCFVEESL